MSHPGFVHLRVHSTFSFLDGVPPVEGIAQAAHDLEHLRHVLA